jgi:hypothetical protein
MRRALRHRAAGRGVTRLAVAVAGCLLAAGALAGCSSARSSLGTSDSACYLALPTATKAVENHGRLVGVHLFKLSALRRQAPKLYRTLAPTGPATERVCVVAFDGHFEQATVSRPLGRTSGRLAVVVSTTPANRLLGTVIFAHAPLHFGHPHIG